MAADSAAPRADGLKTVWDTIIAPREAFESLRAVPTWGWALAITILLSALGSYLLTPALQHAYANSAPQMMGPQFQQMTPEQQQASIAVGQKFITFGYLASFIAVPVICFIEALIMLLFNALGRGEGSLAKYFAASCNIAVPAVGLGSVINAVIVMARGAQTFQAMRDVQGAVPSLAMLAPGAGLKLSTFLATFTPFTIWGTALSIVAMLVIGRVPKLQAWLAGIVLFLIPSLLAVAFAK